MRPSRRGLESNIDQSVDKATIGWCSNNQGSCKASLYTGRRTTPSNLADSDISIMYHRICRSSEHKEPTAKYDYSAGMETIRPQSTRFSIYINLSSHLKHHLSIYSGISSHLKQHLTIYSGIRSPTYLSIWNIICQYPPESHLLSINHGIPSSLNKLQNPILARLKTQLLAQLYQFPPAIKPQYLTRQTLFPPAAPNQEARLH